MSDQIIKVLEYLGDKLGIAIDWTAENVIPYAEQLFKRYVTFKITYTSIGIFIALICATTAIVLGIKLTKGCVECTNTGKDNLWWDRYGPSAIGIIALCVIVIFGAIGIVALSCNISSLIQWIIIPEIPFAKEVAALLGTAI